MESFVSISDSLTVGSSLSVTAETCLDGKLSVSSSLYASEDAIIRGDISISNSLAIGSIVSIGDLASLRADLSILGAVKFESDPAIYGGDFQFISGNSSSHTGYLHGMSCIFLENHFLGMWVSDIAITTSDLRFKRDITPLNLELTKRGNNTSATDALDSLRPVAYTMNSENQDSSRRFGFIAQELEKTLPDLVYNTSETGSKGIIYEDLIALLTSALQETHARMLDLSRKVAEHEHVISSLSEAVKTLSDQRVELAIELEEMKQVRDPAIET
jgi:hypothetical protein